MSGAHGALATLATIGLGVALGWALPAHAVIEDCDNGVSFSNGSTTRGLTATVRCVDRETRKPYRTVGLRDGRQHGPAVWFNADTGKPEREESWNDGKRDGVWRRYDRDGRLQEESTYADDRERGPYKRFDPQGKLRAQGWASGGDGRGVRLEYDPQGRLTALQCSDAPRLDVDREPCGFGARSTVRFAPERDGSERSAQYLDGKLDGSVRETLGGELRSERSYAAGDLREEKLRIGGELRTVFRKLDGDASERSTFFDDGHPKAQASIAGSRVVGYRSWWQNGQKKLEASVGERDAAQVRTFHDDGKPHETYAGRLRRLERSLDAWFEPIGEFRSVARDGKPLMTGRYERDRFVGESNEYDDAGTLRRRAIGEADGSRRVISYDERGRQTSDQSFYPDGSRRVSSGDGRGGGDEQFYPDGSRKR